MNPITINNFQDYKNFHTEVLKNSLISLGYEVPEKTIQETVKNDFKQQIEPLLKLKNTLVGSENSLFDPLRKITSIIFYCGEYKVCFKYPRGKKTYFESIKNYSNYFLKR